MASNRPAPEALCIPNDGLIEGADGGDGPGGSTAYAAHSEYFDPSATSAASAPAGYAGYAAQEPPASWEEWNPTADTVRPVRGKHRIHKKGGGGLARSSTVLGVGVIAAVGAGGIATAQGGKPPVSISLPDMASVADSLPGVGSLIDGDDTAEPATAAAAAPLSSAGVTGVDAERGTTDAGEALRARILQQAENQRHQADDAQRRQAEDAAVTKAAATARSQQGKAAAEAKAKAAEEKREKEEAARKKREAERLAKLAKSYTLPASSYVLTSHFGDSGSMWSSGQHTGLDFAGSSGSPLKAVHSGTITEAGWAGAYGYRTVLKLDDGTEIWYCHQSSLSVSVGQKVSTGDVIGRMGGTGNVTGVHLHLEVRTSGGGAIDPLSWLRGKGLTP
ncbi:M23 family metallopeptidase [Streptomyces spectabilis]|uniref:M23 family metallopeptidase n=1 Tax=Streptomyces spectabilis TaxID=68270 RepID=A0A5P2XCB4_STRST|nr:M23 family metallopeptidase [Streptomyces spectabilis]MBB5104131.1 murein DD-endopeptidase MepM/ murein hydrolase activator NlpD [Streptomyces spectabilis]MCI3903639.1 M23 family metallopeptidase [Streptomyces spectabilis]QEV60825.1 M23 family metallopeptidase [Streptomyces spectabilis]GGV39581.1 peptidase [Streptomyces spectabilis]